MKTIAKRVSLLILLFYVTTGKAQYAITSGGKSTDNSSGEISYTVGQLAFETTKNSQGSISAGVQQPFEISTVLSNPNFSELNINLVVYPNPTLDNLTLKIENNDKNDFHYQIIDINGRILIETKLIGNDTNIQMGNFIKATYFLKITQNNKEVKTFKIIKN